MELSAARWRWASVAWSASKKLNRRAPRNESRPQNDFRYASARRALRPILSLGEGSLTSTLRELLGRVVALGVAADPAASSSQSPATSSTCSRRPPRRPGAPSNGPSLRRDDPRGGGDPARADPRCAGSARRGPGRARSCRRSSQRAALTMLGPIAGAADITQPEDVRVRRALLSVSDKRGIVDFARGPGRARRRDRLHRRDRPELSERRARRSARSTTSPASRRSWTAASRRCTRKLYAGLLAVRDNARALRRPRPSTTSSSSTSCA